MTDPFSSEGRFEERRREAEQARAAKRMKEVAEGVIPPSSNHTEGPPPVPHPVRMAATAVCTTLAGEEITATPTAMTYDSPAAALDAAKVWADSGFWPLPRNPTKVIITLEAIT